ncbi:MAG: hypothetical protein PWQ61_1589 [Betaproteobacteria bacterium]|nr:hypothetical protein [Betaproteobacteria bacterium]
MNQNEQDIDELCADQALIADQEDADEEGLQFTAEEIAQLRAEGEMRRIEDLKQAFQMFSYSVGVGPTAGRGFLVTRGSFRQEVADYAALRQIAIDRGVVRA